MSWIEEQTDEGVKKLSRLMNLSDLKEFFEAYWPDEETIEEYPELQDEKAAFQHAMDGFYDNNHDSGGEVGIDMICAMVDHVTKDNPDLNQLPTERSRLFEEITKLKNRITELEVEVDSHDQNNQKE